MPRGKKYTNEKILPQILFESRDPLNRLFSFIGTLFLPFLYFLIIAVLMFPYLIGHLLHILVYPLKRALSKRDIKVRSQSRQKQKNAITKPYTTRIFWKLTLIACVPVFFLSTIGGVLFYYYILQNLPDPKTLISRDLPVSTKIYDRNGVLLYTIYKDHNRTPIPLSEVPQQMKLATLAVEDAQFYEHPGVSVRGIFRSIKTNFKTGTLSGGSTITQQLVKNAFLTPEKTLTRKLKEAILAILVERIYTKDQILEMYMNEVSFGGTAYGIQEAAQTYFGKDAKDLSLPESALLAGLPKSPTKYSPFGQNPQSGRVRQKQVLQLMQENKFITEEQRHNAESTSLVFANHKTDIKAPHFVSYVKELLEEQYGTEVVEHGGLSVVTSLDYEIQKLAEKVVHEEVEKLKPLHVSNGAILVSNPVTGEVLSMVGSEDYFDLQNDGNVNVILRPRQPGSSIKVINYAYALSHGFTPASLLEDEPITFLTDGQPPYTPKNYEGGFKGKITLRNALAESRNVPAVRVLFANGVINMIEEGRSMGITTWDNPQNYGLSLTLGGGEVRLLDLARVYGTLANYGNRPPIKPILKVTNYKGQVLDQEVCDDPSSQGQIASTSKESISSTPTPLTRSSLLFGQVLASELPSFHVRTTSLQQRTFNSCSQISVLDPRVAFQITDILRDNDARAPSFGTNSLLVIPKHPEVAVKTGTSNDLRDNLAIGYTKDYLVAVWVGNNNSAPMSRIASGVTGATPIWNKILSSLLSEKESSDWPVPSGLTKLSICPYTGTLACGNCKKDEWFLDETKPSAQCKPEHLVIKNNESQNDPSIAPPVKLHQFIDLRKIKSNQGESSTKKQREFSH